MDAGKLPDHLILFDGDCTMCNRHVGYVFDLDRKGIFYYSSQQSEIGRQIRDRFGIPEDQMNTVLYIRNGKLLTRSDAALNVLKQLRWVWPLYFLVVIPRPVRDAIYDLVARNRYRMFGRSKDCKVPSSVLRERILG